MASVTSTIDYQSVENAVSPVPTIAERLIQNQLFDRRFLRELGRACGSPELDQVGQPSVLKATSAFAIVLLTKIPHE